MKRLLMMSGLLMLATLTFFSCQKTNDDLPTGDTTVTEDKAFITTTYSNTIHCIEGIRDGDFSQTLIKFAGLANGESVNEDWMNSMSDALENIMGTFDLDANGQFNFTARKGTYEWNRVTHVFTKTASTTGIFINFPSDPTKTTNNINVRITTYADALYHINAENIYLPTNVKATILKDNVEIASVDGVGNFSSGNFPSPIDVVLTLKLSPHTYKFTINRLTSTQFSVKMELGGDCGSVVESKITFLNDDYNNLVIQDDLSSITATYTKDNFVIGLNWDAKTYYAISNPSTENLNNTISCTVSNAGFKIGDLKFKDVNGSRKVYIYYKDGSSEDVAVYNNSFTTQLKDILRPYAGNDVDDWF